MKENYEGIICRGSYVFGTACGHCEKCKDELEDLRKKEEAILASPLTSYTKLDLNQYKKYPALYNLLDMLLKYRNIKGIRSALSCVNEYNKMLKSLKDIVDIQPQQIYRIAVLIQKDFQVKSKKIRYLNQTHKDHLNNYYKAKLREFGEEFKPVKDSEWQILREQLNKYFRS